MSDKSFRTLDPRTLRTSVTEAIRQVILDGTLLPGEQVNQAHIAEQLGVSRGPVREALGQLEEEGLIKNIPYKGTFVTEITSDYVAELYSLRRVLETFAIQRAVERATPSNLETLRLIVANMREAAEAGDSLRLGQLDITFHYEICHSAHHMLLMQMWKSIEMGVRRCLALRHRIYRDPRDIVGTHPDILAALETGDAALASRLLDAHIKEAGDLLQASWLASGELGADELRLLHPEAALDALTARPPAQPS